MMQVMSPFFLGYAMPPKRVDNVALCAVSVRTFGTPFAG